MLHTPFLAGMVLAQATCAAQTVSPPASEPVQPAAMPEARSQDQPLPPLDPDQERDLAFLAAVLGNPANDQETRTGAAERLLEMNAPQAIRVLDEALRGGEAPVMRAVIEAMGRRSEPVPELLDAAISALDRAEATTLDALSIVLAKYEDAAFQRLATMAQDADLPEPRRLGPIHALGAFPTRECGDQLMALADPRRDETDAVRAEAFASLRRLSGLDFGDDYQGWRTWWTQARDKSPGDWARELVRQYQDRNTELERLNADLAARYVALLRELYRSLPLERQIERLAADLEDALPVVRRFAMDWIGRLLRDSERIPDGHRQLLAAALDDRDPVNRRRAAELLDELDEPDLALLIAARLETETDRQVLSGYLAVLSNRPSAAALGPILARLDDPDLHVTAAASLWSLLRSPAAPEPLPPTVIEAVRAATTVRQSPPLVRLLAFVGEDQDLQSVIPLLDGADAGMKTAAAEGLCARQRRQPLLDRVDDETIYPFAVRVLAEGPPTLETFALLAGLTPTDAGRSNWEQGVIALASRLPPENVLGADEMLAATERATAELRASVLQQAATLPAEAMPHQRRERILARLAPLLIEAGRALDAFELLNSMNGQSSGLLAEARFQAALHAGRYEPAAQIHPEPAAWVALLTELVSRDAVAAVPLRDEILRRFAGRLEGEDKAAFEAASAALPAPRAPGAAGPDGSAP